MTKNITFAIAGFGFIGQKHKYFIEQNDQCSLTALIDNTVEDADYASIEEFIEKDNRAADAVCITTPNGLHSAHAKKLIRAGYHVVIEKPLGLSATATEELMQLAKSMDRRVFVVMQNRYSPLSKWLKQISDSKLLGSLYMVQVNCFWNRDERYYDGKGWHGSKALDGGTLFTQFSHFVDMLYWCFGKMQNFDGEVFNFNHKHLIEFEDSGMLRFDFAEGGKGQLNYSTSCHAKNLESSITILAEHGTVKLGGQYMDQIIHCEIQDYQLPDHLGPGPDFGPYRGNSANHRFIIQNVVDTLRGLANEHTPISDGVEVVRTIEEMYKAVR